MSVCRTVYKDRKDANKTLLESFLDIATVFAEKKILNPLDRPDYLSLETQIHQTALGNVTACPPTTPPMPSMSDADVRTVDAMDKVILEFKKKSRDPISETSLASLKTQVEAKQQEELVVVEKAAHAAAPLVSATVERKVLMDDGAFADKYQQRRNEEWQNGAQRNTEWWQKKLEELMFVEGH